MPIDARISRQPDVIFEDHGTVWLLRPVAHDALEWAGLNLQSEPHQRTPGGIAIDHRCVRTVIDAMQTDGFEVEEVRWTSPTRWLRSASVVGGLQVERGSDE